MWPTFIRYRPCLGCLFFLLTYALSAAAQCEHYPWVAVWPNEHTTTIQPRQLFLLSAGSFSNARSGFRQLGRQIPLYLRSTHDSVPLRVLERPVNPQSSDMQLLLQPVRPLLPDTLYSLRYAISDDSYRNLFRMRRARAGSKQLVPVYRWRVAATPDTEAPRWTGTPAMVRREYSENSEGINNYVLFSGPVQDDSPVLVRATIWSARLAAPVISYLTLWQNQLGIGWFTCGGDFTFQWNETCTVAFEALDAAGNRSTATGRPIAFRAPSKPKAEPTITEEPAARPAAPKK
ncbi:hypothetical protein ACFPAF_13820 [Hymenobacter endophyticus]|uniref:DUF4843 domain-containing protein n=1 Tax=Hymenobacter endophyticus TaxID=3076335 RepID=A0ABU3TJC5_9BACT|nr:hypothetical protein [Hymenobacter endophyticus]MDU0371479.1 hypothetical protein [Hymenobacter endophyticus]